MFEELRGWLGSGGETVPGCLERGPEERAGGMQGTPSALSVCEPKGGAGQPAEELEVKARMGGPVREPRSLGPGGGAWVEIPWLSPSRHHCHQQANTLRRSFSHPHRPFPHPSRGGARVKASGWDWGGRERC